MIRARWVGVLIITVAVVVSPVVAVTEGPVDATSPPDVPTAGTADANVGEQARSPHLPGADTPRVQAPADTDQVQAPTDTGPIDIDPAELPGDGTPADPYIVTSASELQAMEDDLDAAYRLGAEIDASATTRWHGGDGFDPIGESSGTVSRQFSGTFDGAGYTITGLHIDRPATDYVGLFGGVADPGGVSNVTLTAVAVNGSRYVGGLVGRNDGTVRGGSATGAVNGSSGVGGLVGLNDGTVRNAFATGAVNGSSGVGGLVGHNFRGMVRNAFATGAVNGSSGVGGLVGDIDRGGVRDAFASGAVTGSTSVGGLVGGIGRGGGVSDAFASGTVTGATNVGGLAGSIGFGGRVSNVSATGRVNGSTQVGGLVGYSWGRVSNASATGAVNGSFQVGGLVGHNDRGGVDNAFATGAVTGSDEVGGLLGKNEGSGLIEGIVRNTFATGPVTGSTQVGGLAGRNVHPYDGSITESYWDVETTGQSTAGDGNGLTTAQMTGSAARTNMTGLAFVTVWQTRRGEYPVLETTPRSPDGSGPVASPRASFTVSSETAEVGTTVTFDASGATDPDGTIVSYEWELTGDGSIDETGEFVSYVYASSGDYEATLTVTDDDGATAQITRILTVSAPGGTESDETTDPETRTDATRRTDETGTPSQETPGFGIGVAIAGIGGAGYMLKRRLNSTDDEQ